MMNYERLQQGVKMLVYSICGCITFFLEMLALQGLRGPAIFASILSILAYDYFFIKIKEVVGLD